MSNHFDKYGQSILKELNVKRCSNRNLANILKFPEINSVPRDRIAEIWKEHHERKPFHVSLAMNRNHYEAWMCRANIHSFTLLPLIGASGKGDNIENYIVEHKFNGMNAEIGFCKLDEYKLCGSSAKPAMTIYGYGELLSTKQVGLFSGSFNNLGRSEANVLLVSASELYVKMFDWIQRFNSNPDSFDYQSFQSAFMDMLHSVSRNGN
jgi:hypothetical protein